jgi:hypothetical protein
MRHTWGWFAGGAAAIVGSEFWGWAGPIGAVLMVVGVVKIVNGRRAA